MRKKMHGWWSRIIEEIIEHVKFKLHPLVWASLKISQQTQDIDLSMI